jgi:hypothetical protein
MSKDIKDMNSVEYGEYLIQNQRAWKNQQYDRAMKDREKQQIQDLLFGSLGLISNELAYSGNQKIQELNFKKLPDMINAVTTMAEGNAIAKERQQALNQYGTPENVVRARAIAHTFRAPDLQKKGITDLASLDDAYFNNYIEAIEYQNIRNEYQNNYNRLDKLWKNNQSFDKYTDTYVKTNIDALKSIKEQQPSIGHIGRFRGDYNKYVNQLETAYSNILSPISAGQIALEERNKLMASGDVSGKINTSTVEKQLRAADVPFAAIKARLADEFAGYYATINDADRIERDFERLVGQAYEKGGTLNPRALLMQAATPYLKDINYNFFDAMVQDYNTMVARKAPLNLINATIENKYGIKLDKVTTDVKSVAAAKLYSSVQNNATGSLTRLDVAQLLSSSDTRAVLENNLSLVSDVQQAYMLEEDTVKQNYKNKALIILEDMESVVNNSAQFKQFAADAGIEQSKQKTLQNVLSKLTERGDTGDRFVNAEVYPILEHLALNMYEMERNGIDPDQARDQALINTYRDYINKLDFVNNKIVTTGLITQTRWNKGDNPVTNIQKVVDQNKTTNPYSHLTTQFDKSLEQLKDNPDNVNARETALVSGATLLNEFIKRNPMLNTSQKLRESSATMNELLNQLEFISPGLNLQELLDNAEPDPETTAKVIIDSIGTNNSTRNQMTGIGF